MTKSTDIIGRRCVYRWRTDGTHWRLSAGSDVIGKVLPDATYDRMFRIDVATAS